MIPRDITVRFQSPITVSAASTSTHFLHVIVAISETLVTNHGERPELAMNDHAPVIPHLTTQLAYYAHTASPLFSARVYADSGLRKTGGFNYARK